VKVTCPGACSFTVKLGIAAKVARKAGLGRKALTIGSARGKLAAGGTKTVKVKLSTKARRKLKRSKKVAANLKVKVTHAGGSVDNLKRNLSLVR
jgi:hypothetical protein